MESLPKDPLLEFRPDTLQTIRKIYELDQPGRMKEAIDILENWVQKQNHFLKKDFTRDYLERTIISTKGLIERAKKQLDKRCTMKTLLPSYFVLHNAKNDFQDVFKVIDNVCLPKVTPDFYRVSFIRTNGKGMKEILFTYYKYIIMMSEYLKLHDYSNGVIFVVDLRNANPTEIVTSFSVTELRQIFAILIDGYGYRIRGIHIINESRAMEAFAALLRQILSEKLGKRIHVYTKIETLYQHISRDILPAEYGGKEKSLKELLNDWIDVLSSKEYSEYLDVMYKAGTDESLRPKDVFNDQYLGIPGTFRTLSVD